jgi:NAD(P)-dependent dehydrogenase (short-subunit alcohol dehydrogenase family)
MSVILITGCSSGFGRAAALAMAEAGHRVVATMRRPEAGADLEQQPNIAVDQLDVTDAASRAGAVSRTLERFGPIDVLVNNAGIAIHGPAEEIPDELLRQQFETNFFGPFALMKEVLGSMIDNGTGRIVNVTSIGGVLSSGFLSTYCATKHALDAVSLGMDIELQPFGIRVVTVVPGGFNTSIATNRPEVVRPDTRYPRAREAMAAHDDRLALRDDLTPVSEAIMTAAFAAEPRARYLVGGGTAKMLVPVVDEGERIHAELRARDA